MFFSEYCNLYPEPFVFFPMLVILPLERLGFSAMLMVLGLKFPLFSFKFFFPHDEFLEIVCIDENLSQPASRLRGASRTVTRRLCPAIPGEGPTLRRCSRAVSRLLSFFRAADRSSSCRSRSCKRFST